MKKVIFCIVGIFMSLQTQATIYECYDKNSDAEVRIDFSKGSVKVFGKSSQVIGNKKGRFKSACQTDDFGATYCEYTFLVGHHELGKVVSSEDTLAETKSVRYDITVEDRNYNGYCSLSDRH